MESGWCIVNEKREDAKLNAQVLSGFLGHASRAAFCGHVRGVVDVVYDNLPPLRCVDGDLIT